MPDASAALRSELAALRRRSRRSAALSVAALLVACLGFLRPDGRSTGSAGEGQPAAPVEVSEVRLLDARGDLRGLLACPMAGPSLTLWDTEGRLAAVLSADGKGGRLRLLDARGEVVFEKP